MRAQRHKAIFLSAPSSVSLSPWPIRLLFSALCFKPSLSHSSKWLSKPELFNPDNQAADDDRDHPQSRGAEPRPSQGLEPGTRGPPALQEVPAGVGGKPGSPASGSGGETGAEPVGHRGSGALQPAAAMAVGQG